MIKFYYDLLSPPSRALLTFFKMNKMPIQEVPVALRKLEHKTEKFQRDVSKFGKMPVIHDGDFRLTESVAILRYMTKKLPYEDFWYPKDIRERAMVDEYLSWTHNNIRLACGMYFFTKWRDPIMTGIPADPKQLSFSEKQLIRVLNEMENLWMEKPYITGNKMTIADVFAFCDLEQIKMTKMDPYENRPKLKAWSEKVKPQLEPYISEHHKFVYKIASM